MFMDTVRGNYWDALLGSVTEASPELLRPTDREERHAWRLVEAELRTKPVDFDATSRAENALQQKKSVKRLTRKGSLNRPLVAEPPFPSTAGCPPIQLNRLLI